MTFLIQNPPLYDSDSPIAALATPLAGGTISIVRISGKGALEVGDRLVGERVRKPSDRPSGTFFNTTIYDPLTKKTVDNVLLLISRAPNSYTGEDTLEIHGHGGVTSSVSLLDAALKAGAREAEAGEFSRRAFLNGKLDLTQAEAICDLINAQTERAAQVALSQLHGALGSRITALYNSVTSTCAAIEYMLDFLEDEIPPGYIEKHENILEQNEREIDELIKSARQNSLMRYGALVVLSGRPNVGKSSLLNTLLGRERAIVHEDPGTTRDTIEEKFELFGVPLRIADTAGLRDSDNPVERAGVERTNQLMLEADLHLRLIDISAPYTKEEFVFDTHAPVIYVITKSDLPSHPSWESVEYRLARKQIVISTKTKVGLKNLKEAIKDELRIEDETHSPAMVSMRHAQELSIAQKQIRSARYILAGSPEQLVLAANHLRYAAEALGRITGKVYSDDLLDALFSNFCVGK